jgi:hypothetical protein
MLVRPPGKGVGSLSSFPFVQFEFAGSFGIDDGRYPVRPAGDPGATEAVLVARTFGAPAPQRRLRRKPKPKQADPEAGPTVPVTELTVIDTERVQDDPEAWLDSLRADEERRAELVDEALAHVARALAARRVASADPAIPDPTLDAMLAIRVGYGEGDALVDGRYQDAVELPHDLGRRSRAAALRPQERMAALLGARERPLVCEELILRARADLDGGRVREATMQIRVGLEAVLAEREALHAPGQDRDLADLEGRRTITGDAANEALRGQLSSERGAEVAETVAICERVLRRRAAHGVRPA